MLFTRRGYSNVSSLIYAAHLFTRSSLFLPSFKFLPFTRINYDTGNVWKNCVCEHGNAWTSTHPPTVTRVWYASPTTAFKESCFNKTQSVMFGFETTGWICGYKKQLWNKSWARSGISKFTVHSAALREVLIPGRSRAPSWTLLTPLYPWNHNCGNHVTFCCKIISTRPFPNKSCCMFKRNLRFYIG